MRKAIIAVSALLVGAGILNAGIGLQATLLGIRAGIESFPTTAIGLIMSFYYIGFAVGSMYCPRIINRLGHIRAFAALAAFASALSLMHVIFVSPAAWSIIRGILGFCFVGLAMAVESWLNASADKSNRGALFSLYMIISLGGTAAGQLLLNLADPKGFELFVMVSVIISLSLAPVVLTEGIAPSPIRNAVRVRVMDLYRVSPVGAFGSLASGFMVSAFWSLGAVYAYESGLSIYETSLFMMFLMLGGMASLWPLGRLSDHMDRRLVLFFVCLCLSAVALAIAFTGFKGEAFYYILIALFGGMILPIYLLSAAHANDFAASKEFVRTSGGLLLLFGAGASIGPLAASALMAWLGPAGIFVQAAITAGLLGLFSLYSILQRPLAMDEEKPKPAAVSLAPLGGYQLYQLPEEEKQN